LNLPIPRNVREVRTIIVMAGWYQRFIANHASLMASITDLTKGLSRKYVWTKEANDAFLKLKSAIEAVARNHCFHLILPYLKFESSVRKYGCVNPA
jgi:hypothetical protein